MFLIDKSYWKIRNTKNKGRGVFARKNIKKGTIIGDYLGKLIPETEEDEYERKYGLYCMYYHDEAVIFPEVEKPGIHLINHSCEPNCWMYTYKGHTLFFAIRDISKGEELTVSYLLEPQEECETCDHKCYCGKENCIKTIHTPKEFYDKWIEFEEKLAEATKAEDVKIHTMLSPLNEYPSSLSISLNLLEL